MATLQHAPHRMPLSLDAERMTASARDFVVDNNSPPALLSPKHHTEYPRAVPRDPINTPNLPPSTIAEAHHAVRHQTEITPQTRYVYFRRAEGQNLPHYCHNTGRNSMVRVFFLDGLQVHRRALSLAVIGTAAYGAVKLGASKAAVAGTLVGLSVANYSIANYFFWRSHMRPTEEHPKNRDPSVKIGPHNSFLTRRVAIRDHHHRDGVKVWVPVAPLTFAQQHAFAACGMTAAEYFYDLFTFAAEYKVQAMGRILAHDLCIGRFADLRGNARILYDTIVNTSLGCFIEAETGHAIFHDTQLPFGPECEDAFIRIHKLTFEMDHDEHVVTRMLVQMHPRQPNERAEVLVVEDLCEINSVLNQVAGFKSHPHVHWWANGIAEVTPDQWALSRESLHVTQGLNNGSVFSTPPVLLVSADLMARTLHHNVVAEGLPLHNAIPKHVLVNSKLHKMTARARTALARACPEMPKIQIETVIAVTIMHSADHYYADKLRMGGKSEILEKDTTLSRLTITGHNTYRMRNLLCRQHPEDPICRALYESCLAVDADFANDALFLGVVS